LHYGGAVPETLFDELKRYVEFGAQDESALRALHPIVAPRFTQIADLFYARILEHEQARKALQGGESQVGRLKVTLVAWMDKLLSGPWDEQYYEMRARIGRVHVRIALPQHYMFGAMNLVRQKLQESVDGAYLTSPDKLAATRAAVGKILDLELAIMLHTYREDLLTAGARTERLATFGQLVGSIGHELRNPLGVMETSLYILRSRVGADERALKHVERIAQQLTIANSIISDLLDMIRDRPIKAEQVSLDKVVDAAAAQVRHPDGVRVEISGVQGLPELAGDASALRQVFVNLIDNAVHACGETGLVRVEGAAEGGLAVVAVEDSGPGVDEGTRRRLFEPLITTKQKGIGLGLALVKRLVERQRGTVAYEPRGPGARFVVRLPLAAG
jgi:signal transduction histidine kinase